LLVGEKKNEIKLKTTTKQESSKKKKENNLANNHQPRLSVAIILGLKSSN